MSKETGGIMNSKLKACDINPDTIQLPPNLKGRLWLTFKEFASLFGICLPTVRNWYRLGLINVTYFTPSHKYIHISEIQRFKEGRMMKDFEEKKPEGKDDQSTDQTISA